MIKAINKVNTQKININAHLMVQAEIEKMMETSCEIEKGHNIFEGHYKRILKYKSTGITYKQIKEGNKLVKKSRDVTAW